MTNSDTRNDQNHVRVDMRLICVGAIYALVAFEGASQVFSYDNKIIYFIFAIGLVLFLSIWAFHNSRQRNVWFPFALRILYIVFCPLSFAVYILATRKWMGLVWIVVNIIGIAIISNIAFYAAYYVIYFGGWWDLYDPMFYDP